MTIDHLNKCLDIGRKQIGWLLDLENTPYTNNTHYYNDYKEKYLAKYRLERTQCKGEARTLMQVIKDYNNDSDYAPNTIMNEVMGNLAHIGLTGVGADDLAKLLPTDPFEPALQIMASVRAYFQGKWFIYLYASGN